MNDEVNSENQPVDQQVTEQPYSVLVDAIVARLDDFFTEQVKALFSKTDEYLFNSADNASSIAEQNSMFEFMNDLRAQKEQIESKFFEELNVYLRPISEAPTLPKKKRKKEASGGLSLIANEEMDEMVILTTISSKANMDYAEEITHLTARLQQIALKNQSIFHPEATKPVNICNAFHDALADSGFSNKNKLILYKQFGQDIIYTIKDLYDDLNKMMIDEDILPNIELGGVLRQDDSGSSGEDYIEDNYDEETAQQIEELAQQAQTPPGSGAGPRIGGGARHASGAAGAPPGAAGSQGAAPGGGQPAGGSVAEGSAPAGGGAAYGSGHVTGGPGNAPTMSAGSAPASGDTGQGQAPTGGDDDRIVAGMPVSQVRQNIQNFVGGVPSDSDSALPSGGGAGGGGAYYTHVDVVSALSDMQNATQVAPDAKLEFNASAIKKAVLSTIGEKEGGAVTKRVNQVSEKTIDFIKLIFDAIIDDKSITDTIKALLLSLQIPVIKAAMLDSEFFVDDKHPARLLLDKIAEAGVGVSEHKDPIYIDIEKVVKKLLAEYKEDVAAFKDALDALNQVAEDIRSKAQAREEEAQKQVKHAHARNVVLQEIRKITLGKELPQGIRTLVLKVWPSLMFNHYLRHGKANDEWVELLMILAKVIESCQPITSKSVLEEIGLSYEDIVKATHDKLKKSRKPDNVINKIVDDLRATYQDLIESADIDEAEAEETEPEDSAV